MYNQQYPGMMVALPGGPPTMEGSPHHQPYGGVHPVYPQEPYMAQGAPPPQQPNPSYIPPGKFLHI